MRHTTAPTASPPRIRAGPAPDASLATDDRTTVHPGSVRHFVSHLAQMVLAMMIGMVVGYGGFLAIVGKSGTQARQDYPTASLLVMALSMTIPMVAWMRFRRHTWRNSIEMGAAMLVPVVPFLVCLWAHAFRDAPNGPYMTVSTVAMVGLMLYRWDVYSAHHPPSLAATHANRRVAADLAGFVPSGAQLRSDASFKE